MMTPNELIKEVTRLVLEDHICFVQKSDRAITTFDMERMSDPKIKSEVADLEESTKHIKIGQMPTDLYLREMRDFLDVLTDDDIRKELNLGLNRKNPARNFLQTVENRIDINQHWRRYMAERYEVYVEEVLIRAYNP